MRTISLVFWNNIPYINIEFDTDTIWYNDTPMEAIGKKAPSNISTDVKHEDGDNS